MRYLIILVFVCICFCTSVSYGQIKKSENAIAKQDSTKQRESFKMSLDAIEVRGWIEKPQAIFVIPGINPEVDDIVLDRSFANEILRPLDKDKFEKQKVRKRKTVIPW